MYCIIIRKDCPLERSREVITSYYEVGDSSRQHSGAFELTIKCLK